MLLNVSEERMLVTSDIHLGNWFFKKSRSLFRFLDYVIDGGYSLCINGDGLDILQTSLVKMTTELSTMAGYLGNLDRKARLYYTVGNHDIVLEHFIEDYQFLRLAPFLNVQSGDQRIRVEHGHIYDPAFIRNPDFYFFITRAAGLALRVHPMFYNVHTLGKSFSGWIRDRKETDEPDGPLGIPGEHPFFVRAAQEIVNRGFDSVVFGHTHLEGAVDLGRGKRYFNTGSWLHEPHYVKIENGDVELLAWKD